MERYDLRGLLLRIALGLLVAAALHHYAAAATLDEIKKRGYMIVATEDDYKPFEFVQDGKPMGFDHELLDAFKKTVAVSRSNRKSSRGPACSPASAPASTTWR